ncbi:flavoprotein, partial [uncultured Parasutterella sp.]
MSVLKNKRILLGVSGGIAAYKACELVRLLVKSGAEVRVMMTKVAEQFVGKTTFEALSGHPVETDQFNPSVPLAHIALRDGCDLMVIAPATANIIAKTACGIADDLVSTTILARACPLLIAPAMNVR